MNMFHLAVPIHDIDVTREFYTETFGATVGREYDNYIIFNFFGHQFVTHLAPESVDDKPSMYPRHYGVIFDNKEEFDALYAHCKDRKAPFFEELFERFQDQPGWHFSFFVSDPSNNLIEFKYYVNKVDIFE